MNIFYLPACHVIINHHQKNREHANVIIINIFFLNLKSFLLLYRPIAFAMSNNSMDHKDMFVPLQ